jgi:hypothetical protein
LRSEGGEKKGREEMGIEELNNEYGEKIEDIPEEVE